MNIQDTQKKYGVKVVLELIQTSTLFYDSYTKQYPNNLANALSFSKNPNCTCRNALIKHYNENKQAVDKFTTDFLQEHPSELAYEQFIQKHGTKNMVGQIVRIDKSEEAYKQLSDKIASERWVFRQMSVAIDEQNYVIFFL